MGKSIFQKAVEAVVNNSTGQIQFGAEMACRHIDMIDKWTEVHTFAHQSNPEYDCNPTGTSVVEGIKAEAGQLEGLARVGYTQVMSVHRASKLLDMAVGGETLHMPEGMTFVPVELNPDGDNSPEDLLARAKQAMQDAVDLQHMENGPTIEDPHDPRESATYQAGDGAVSETGPEGDSDPEDPDNINGKDNQ